MNDKNWFIIIFIFITTFTIAQDHQFNCKKVIGCIPSWKNESIKVDYTKLTHAYFCFLRPNIDGTLIKFTTEEQKVFNSFLSNAEKANCKKFISIGGASDTNIEIMANDSVARKTFIKELLSFVKLNQLDGIDFDWELIDTEEDKNNYTQIVKEIRKETFASNVKFVASVPFGNYWGQWISDEAILMYDWIQVMVYDQTGTWSDSPYGNHSTMEHLKLAHQYWVKDRGISPLNIVIGVPYYGYQFKSVTGGIATGMPYCDIVAKNSNLTSTMNKTDTIPACFYNGQLLIEEKSHYIFDNDFAGVLVWEMTQDTKSSLSLHQALIKIFIKRCTK